MRFSLATLLIFLLFVGAMVGVYLQNGPWRPEFRAYRRGEIEKYLALELNDIYGQVYGVPESPDHTRCASKEIESTRINIVEIQNDGYRLLCEIKTGGMSLFPIRFIDDDTLLLASVTLPKDQNAKPVETYFFWHRRFPEWWWGHFYRPEVWLAIIFGALWVWRIVRWYRARRRPDSISN